MARLSYLLNPLMPCASQLMAGQWVARLADLLPALEEVAGHVDHKQSGRWTHISPHSSPHGRNGAWTMSWGARPAAARRTPRAWRKFAYWRICRAATVPRRLPALAVWLAEQAGPVLATWRNRDSRAAIAERLHVLAQAGHLAPVLALLDDPAGRDAERRQAQLAAAEIGRIDAELTQIAGGSAGRASLANRLGQEIAAGIGLATLATVLAVVALG